MPASVALDSMKTARKKTHALVDEWYNALEKDVIDNPDKYERKPVREFMDDAIDGMGEL